MRPSLYNRINNLSSRQNQAGFLMVFLMVGSFLIFALILSISNLASVNFYNSNQAKYRVSTQLAVDAAVSQAISELSASSTWTGVPGEVTLIDENDIKTTYTSTVTDIDANNREVNVTARVYHPSSSTEPIQKRSIAINLSRAGGTPTDFGVVAGGGGINLTTGSSISQGSIFSNGRISMTGGSSMGSSGKPAKIYVANYACPMPANATYPRLCGVGESGQAIAIAPGSSMNGEVRATNQINGSGMSNPGLIAGESVAPAPMPTYDRSPIINGVTSNLTGSAASCRSGATVTWPANVKITGNVTATSGCTVVITGNVWITGSLSLAGSSSIRINNSVAVRPTIMIDGSGGFSATSGSQVDRNSSGLGAYIVTHYANSGCSPNCVNLTGTGLASSINRTTIDLPSGFQGRDTNFYAVWSRVEIKSGSEVGAVSGQTIDISGGGSITLYGGAQDFSYGSSGNAWQAVSYRRVYN